MSLREYGQQRGSYIPVKLNIFCNGIMQARMQDLHRRGSYLGKSVPFYYTLELWPGGGGGGHLW